MALQSRLAPLLFAFILSPSLQSGRAAILGAKDPNVYTEHQYRSQVLEFNFRTTVEAYKQVGKRDAKWDDKAVEFLDGVARSMSNARSELVYQLPNVPALADLESLARDAIALGCDDPLVLDMLCLVLNDQNKRAEILKLTSKAPDEMMKSHYSPYRAANAARRALGQVSGRDAKQKYERMIYDAELAAATFCEKTGVDRRIIFSIIASDLSTWDPDRQKSFYEDLKSGKADPWLVNMAGGIYHIHAAWAARGVGYANTVTPEGWRKMASEMALARQCLVEAYRLEPTFPEAATSMITVVMGGSSGSGETLRSWFDRAVTAQFDYEQAYLNYIYALWPRWQGGFPTMYEFAMECVETQRFDTRVPMMLIKVLTDIQNDMDGRWDYWRRPGVMEMVEMVLARTAEAPQTKPRRVFYYSELAGYAWQTGRYDIGRFALDKLQESFDANGFAMADTIPTRTYSGIYALTGPSASTVAKAEADVAEGKLARAIETYKALIPKVLPTDASAEWFRSRPTELTMLQSFNAGDWIDLIPPANLAGWYTVAGKYRVQDKAIIGTTADDGAMLVCGSKFGTRWELRGTVEVIAPKDEKQAGNSNAGPMFGIASPTKFSAVTMYPLGMPQAPKTVLWQVDPDDKLRYFQQIAPVSRFHLVCWDGQMIVEIDDRALPSHRDGVPLAALPEGRIGLGSISQQSGVNFKFTQIQIHRLAEQPAAPPPP